METKTGSSTFVELMRLKQFDLAYSNISNDLENDPKHKLLKLNNRGLCLLQLNRPKDALNDFEAVVENYSDSSSGYINAGIANWWLKQPLESVIIWRKGLKTKYADAAGGFELPALLFFAATKLSDLDLEKDAISLLEKISKSKLNTAWPAPISDFLLNQITEDDLIATYKFKNANLEARRLDKAYFWIGIVNYRARKEQKYKYYLEKAVTGDILNPEHYLAKFELENYKEAH